MLASSVALAPIAAAPHLNGVPNVDMGPTNENALARILELTLNGRRRVDAVPDNLLLLDYLREVVGPHRHQDRLRRRRMRRLHGAGRRSAAAVLPDARARPSRGRRVDTVESLGTDGRLSAVQRGFHEKLGAQCGYCTPGFIMASAGLLRRNPHPSDDEIREALGSNICRCTGYVKIIEAVKYAAAAATRSRGARHERDRARRAPSATTCRWSTARRRCRAAPNTPPTSSRPACSPAASSAAPIRTREILEVDVSEAAQAAGRRRRSSPAPTATRPSACCRSRAASIRWRATRCAIAASRSRRSRRSTTPPRARRSRCIRLKVRELPAYYTAQGRARARRRRAPRAQARQSSSATCCSSSAASSEGFAAGRSRARGHLQLRRGLPEPDGDARRGRRLRRRARPHDGACQHPGALLRAPDAGADPRHGHVAHPRDQAACRRRLRLPHRDAQRRADRRAAGAQGRRRACAW